MTNARDKNQKPRYILLGVVLPHMVFLGCNSVCLFFRNFASLVFYLLYVKLFVQLEDFRL